MKYKVIALTAILAASSLSLVACNSLDNATKAFYKEELFARYEDGIYGNIFMPEELYGAEITWESSDEEVINPYWDDLKAPGVVTRFADDCDVTLTATVKKDGKVSKLKQTVTVKAEPKQIYDEDYEGYLFAHFVGESYGEGPQTMEGHPTGEQIFFALADVGQGLHFKDMNGSKMGSLKPVLKSYVGELGVRDPFMLRSPEGDTFYLIATDLSVYTRGGWGDNAKRATKTGSLSIIIWESHDLVNWTEGRQIKVARDDAGMAWAPEMIYCEETGEYLIFFSSTILDEYDEEDRSKNYDSNIILRDCVYYTTTRDFAHFGETKTFIPSTKYQDGVSHSEREPKAGDNNNYRKVIDGSVIKIGNYYYSAAKDGGNGEDGGGIRIQKTQDLYDGEWTFVQNLADVGFQAQDRNADNKCLEGPEWFILNRADRKNPSVQEIGLMADFYANTSVGYIPWSTTNIEDINNANNSWRILESGANKDFSWDGQTKRHGTIIRITAEEAARLKEAYPIG